MRHWRNVTRAGVLALLLSGCISAEEQWAADTAQCEQYGFLRGTDAFANCLVRLDEARRPRPGVSLGVGIGGRF